ncbi:MAG: selenium-binding family protein [Candidatus Eremiobacteraeota bacterium]|nr:selenium-binding family protein [Candidatus Eremiobacteraeota bacterium]MBV9057377.1 selenium-binding family protein [Candidatus Eremiobacteraeota bacterium]
MQLLKPDPTFYASAKDAIKAPPETLAYVALLSASGNGVADRLAVVDTDTSSSNYATEIGGVDLPNTGDELHHFGWNACSAALCPFAPHPHVERRYLIVPGLRSSRIHLIDTKPNPAQPRIVRVIEPEEIIKKTGYTRPHTVHCGPDAIYVSALGNADGDGPGGIFTMDCDTFDVIGPWEADRGPQYFAYDFWWHLTHDVMITSEWGTPKMIEGGVNPELLLGGKYGHHLHFWDLRKRRNVESKDLGAEQQMVLELRPSHDPANTYGFVGVVLSLKDLSSSIWLWHRTNGSWDVTKVIEIPAEPADPEQLPDLLKGFSAVPPLLSDIDLSLDDKYLYASCWGTGEMRQYDVSDPFNPKLVGSVRIGGIAKRTPHPANPSKPLAGGPQMVEISRDGKRVYFTNSLYRAWDDQFYPDGVGGWMVKLDVADGGKIAFDEKFFAEFDPSRRVHQVRLQGGDASSDSYCYS